MKLSLNQSLLLGARASPGYFVSTFLFGIMFGMAAASAGIDLGLATLMSASVFSASAQFVTLEFWQSPLPLGTIALSVFLVSTRNILLGMSMANHFDGHSVARRGLWLFLMNDPGVVTSFRLAPEVDRLGYVTGYGVALMTSWLTSTLVGYGLFSVTADVELSAISFAGPMVMTTMMILFAKGSDSGRLPWVVSGLAALLFHELGVAIYWVLPAAVLCGVLAALAVPRKAT